MPYCVIPKRQELDLRGGDYAEAKDNIKIFYETYGKGSTRILMIMGLAASHNAWKHQVKDLTGTDIPNSISSTSSDQAEATLESYAFQQTGNQNEARQSADNLKTVMLKVEETGSKKDHVLDSHARKQLGEKGWPSSVSYSGENEYVEMEASGESSREHHDKRKGRTCCVYDNRGVGKSSCPKKKSDYTTEIMAGDALALMDHLGWDKCHVVGHSMGGMIACKVASLAPHRLLSLALMSVSCGGFDLLPRFHYRTFSLMTKFMAAKTPELRAHVDLDCHFSKEYLEEIVDGQKRRHFLHKEYVYEITSSGMQTPHGRDGHFNACWTHSFSESDAKSIRQRSLPVAVIHGK